MKNKVPYTIVIPACDTAPWLAEMLRSVRNQSYGNFEALVVVEESKDRSLDIAENFAAEDGRFRVVSLPRSGSAAASRNYGIRHAHGEYILFADGDDWLEEDALERLHEFLERTGPLDAVFFSGKEYYEQKDGTLKFSRMIGNLTGRDEGKVMSGPEIITRVGESGRPADNFTPLHLYSAEYLREFELFQKEGMMHEDSEWVPRSWYYVRKGSCLNVSLYNYRRRGNSVTTSCSCRLLHDIARLLLMQIDFLFSNEFPDSVKKVWENQYLSLFFWYFFNPAYKKRFPEETRLRELRFAVGTPEKEARLRRLASGASLPKRIAVPLVLYAGRSGRFLPAELYFRFAYYPFSRLKQGRRS